MFRTKLLLVLFLLAFGSANLTTAAAADNVLKVVPNDAMGVAVVNSAVESERKLKALITQLKLPVPDVGGMVRQRLAGVEGIDGSGSLAIAAILPDGPGGPTMVAFVPISDYDKLLKSVEAEKVSDTVAKATIAGRPSVVARKGDYVLVADASSEAILNKVLKSSRCLADDMPALAERIAKADLYAAAAPAGIKMAQQQLLAGLGAAKAAIQQQQGEQAQQALMGIQVYESMFQSLDKEITHAVVCARLEEAGSVRLVFSAALAPEGLLAKMGGTPETAQIDLLADLPDDDFLFAGGGKMPQQWGKQLVEFSMNMMKTYFQSAELTDEQLREIVAASAESMQGMRSMSMMMGLVPADQPLYGNTIIVLKTDDSKAYMDAYVKSLERMSEMMKQSEKPPFSYEIESIQLGGVTGVRIGMQMKGLIPESGAPNMDVIFKTMFGSTDTMSIYLAPRDKHTVLGTYVSKDLLEDMLKQEGDVRSLSGNPQVAKALAMLPKGSSGVGLWSPSGTFKFVARMAGAIEPQAAAKIPQFPDCPPVGLATNLNAKRLDVDVVFPAELLQAAATFFQQVQAEQQPR